MQNPKSPKNKNKPTRQNTTCQRQEKKFKKAIYPKRKTTPLCKITLPFKFWC